MLCQLLLQPREDKFSERLLLKAYTLYTVISSVTTKSNPWDLMQQTNSERHSFSLQGEFAQDHSVGDIKESL